MAPDQAFAAQMWLWPDALVKRDANGAILFVNAAFLALYGGRVEDWHGMGLSGWANPPAANTSQRFETRSATVNGEAVYDWIESAGPDGSALAIARDVSELLPPPGGQPMAVAEPIAAANAPTHMPEAPPVSHFETVMAEPQQVPPLAESTPAPQAHESVPMAEPEVVQALAPALEIPEPLVAEAPAASFDTVAVEAPSSENRQGDADAFEAPVSAPALEAPAAAPVEPPQAEVPVAAEEPPATEPSEREFERRALPVEDTSAVLGNNWRDAVIAKAVGAGEDEMETQDAAAAPDPAPAPKGDSGEIRILLAEDNAINALLTRTLLEAEGCVVDTVEDGALAVDAMRAKRYDLIFMDMRMPNMDGLDATRKIRSMDHASKGLPIIALTANAFDDDRNACFDAGMNDFMTKPVSAEELSEMVARWTSESAALKATA